MAEKPLRRVLGTPLKAPDPIDRPITPPNPIASSETANIHCPICNDEMVSLLQLNRHIDDVHGAEADIDPPKKRTPQRRTIKLDLFDNNLGFGLSDNSDGSGPSSTLSRSHWKHPSSSKANLCSYKGCRRILNVKNGVVNCRKCGDLFCNDHTGYKVLLSNGPSNAPIYDPQAGVSSRCCEACYLGKPDLVLGTQVNSRDLSEQFFAVRRIKIDDKQWARDAVQKRYIKLVNILAENFLWHALHKPSLFLYFGEPSGEPYPKEKLLEAQKEIVGYDNWQRDEDATHCPTCFVKFNYLIRKHHCRLCGTIVSDSSFNSDDPSMSCSVQVPVGIFLQKLPKLNYSPQVKSNWNLLTSTTSDVSARTVQAFSFRCCRSCKNLLLYDVKGQLSGNGENEAVFAAYDEILALKSSIMQALPRYEGLIEENKEIHNESINKLRTRLLKLLKDFELATNSFRQRYFQLNQETRKYSPTQSPLLVTNIYKTAVVFLQESLLQFKMANDRFKELENERLAGQRQLLEPASGPSTTSPSPLLSPEPRLTKKEIRELREQLMVISEQKFLVEKLIGDAKKQRRFDELKTLTENTNELEKRISELENQLGEFGFG